MVIYKRSGIKLSDAVFTMVFLQEDSGLMFAHYKLQEYIQDLQGRKL